MLALCASFLPIILLFIILLLSLTSLHFYRIMTHLYGAP